MSYFKTLTGTWSKIDEVLKGVVDSSLTARCITGSETDTNYELTATIKIANGKGAVIVFFTYDEDWLEHYIEMVLDPTAKKVTLDGVIRNVDGSEKSRQTLASRNMEIQIGTNYDIRIVTKTLEDGSRAVYGFINDFQVVYAEDLAPPFVSGMHGFECLGTENQYSEFSNVTFIVNPYCSKEEVKERLKIKRSEHQYDVELSDCIKEAQE